MTAPSSAASRKPGRPSSAHHGTFGGASLDRPNHNIGWSDGIWSGTPEAVAEARELCALNIDVYLTPTGPVVPANADDPHVAFAVADRVLRHRACWYGDLPGLPDGLDLPDGAVS